MPTGIAPRLFRNEDLERGELFQLAPGLAAAMTARHPEREGPNEDCAAVVPLASGSVVLAVADGLGGVRGGDQAALVAIEILAEILAEEGDLQTAVLRAFERTNEAVMELRAATTLSVVTVEQSTVRSYHAGDSPILVVGQRGRIKLQPLLHSPVAYAVESGYLDEREAMHHDERHLVTNMLGSQDMRIEVGPALELARRDTVVVASDGLFDNLHLEEIIELARKGPLEQSLAQLAAASRERMCAPVAGEPSKPDDLTVLLYRSS